MNTIYATDPTLEEWEDILFGAVDEDPERGIPEPPRIHDADGDMPAYDSIEHALENYAKAFLNTSHTADSLAQEIRTLQSRKKRMQEAAETLRKRMLDAMEICDTKKIQTSIATLFTRKNPDKIEPTNIDALPVQFVRIIREPKKRDIMDHYKKTGEIPLGCEFVEGQQSLTIRR